MEASCYEKLYGSLRQLFNIQLYSYTAYNLKGVGGDTSRRPAKKSSEYIRGLQILELNCFICSLDLKLPELRNSEL